MQLKVKQRFQHVNKQTSITHTHTRTRIHHTDKLPFHASKNISLIIPIIIYILYRYYSD